MRFQKRLVLFLYEFFGSVTSSQYGIFCSFTRFQRQSVLSLYKITMTVAFIRLRDFNDVCFIQLRDFGDSQFYSTLRDLNYGRFSVSVSFVLL